ncbi:hypothetical protein ALT_4253 [Aspergillus lentulus]|uniref:Uncharacterized protein n=1 Tax=Aspergillus lentulus TaxID=293939 RepID=A0AAN5YK12_ASPLE|nr:hypothetical protein CNMCM6069_009495 [Aspergillus lentulus]KAF4164671.1 hypothetical protein CNMCM6936_008879 [Aspergillus lentulus]KAF4173914.1 hypothetical protein CNMCM8060_009383 [Aspergillus lentulus]KAF4181965.1 hypothetical protein CNMCM7927_000277 [Aspergillus lentulus]KAF4192970.1 hypothetical protein CNMCM8694_009473 [Aspergillus lentulus]
MTASPERDLVLDSATAGGTSEFQVSKKKRSNSELTEYPRRRATIALTHEEHRSARYVAYERLDVTARARGVNFVQTWTQTVSTGNQESNSMLATN